MRYATLALSGNYRDTAPLVKSPLLPTGRRDFHFDSFLRSIDALLRSGSVGTVVIECRNDFRAGLPAALEGIRRELVRLSAGGKRLIFVAQSFGTAEIYLASACPERIIHPLGTFRYQGLHHTAIYAGRLLRELGLRIHPARRGEFKSAPERLLRNDMSRPDREQYEAYLDAVHTDFTRTIALSLGISDAELQSLLHGRVVSAAEAREHGWVTGINTRGGLEEELKTQSIKRSSLRVRSSIGKGRKLAVLFFEGAIADGRSRRSTITGQTIGAESYIPVVRRLKDDKSTAGVVLRVNSGGGSATASEDILDELRRLAEKKPLYLSFGSAAASGGYWIACAGSKIFAEHSTLTGSIGVFSLTLHADNALRKYGISSETLRRGDSSDRGSLLRSPTRAEQKELEAEVERIYRAFLERVASARGKEAQGVDAVARGRVWSGYDAIEIGLVDRIGGIHEALQEMATELGLRRYKVAFAPRIQYSLFERILLSRFRNAEIGAGDLPATLASELHQLTGRALALSPEALAPDLAWIRDR